MILDAYGRPVQFERLHEEQAAPTLTGVRNIFSIVDTSIDLVPNKIVTMLRQAEYGDPWLYLELAERMEEKDELYQGVLHTRKMAVSQLDIDVQAAGESAQDQDDAAFVRDVLIDGSLDLHDTLFDLLDALGKGFAATEIIWNTEGTNPATGHPWWIPARFAWRDPRWFMFDWISGEQLLVRSLSTEGPAVPMGHGGQPLVNPANVRILGDPKRQEIGLQPMTQPLAPFKFITHVAKAKAGLPIRGGLARIAVWNYFYRNYILKDWATFAEVYSQPLRLGKYGPGATENDKAALMQAVANIGTDAAAIIPDSMMIEFCEVKSPQGLADVYEKISTYLDKRLTIAVLGQELTTSLPKGSGSRAAAEVHDVVRRDIATDDARRLMATLKRDLVKPLIDLNRGPRRRYPTITIGFAEQDDLVALANAAAPFIDRGLQLSEKWVRDKFGAPDPQNGETVLHPVKPTPGASAAGDGEVDRQPAAAISDTPLMPLYTDVDGTKQRREAGAALSAAASPTTRPERSGGKQQVESKDAIECFVHSLLEEHSQPAMAPLIEPLLARLRGAKSYAEMKRLVASAVADMKPDAFADLLARAGFNVQLAARAARSEGNRDE